MRVSLISLSSCSGCHLSLLALGPDLIATLSENALSFGPILMDSKAIVPSDLALVEGCVRNNQDVEELREIRGKVKTLVAFGTCASFGGIPGLGSAFSTAELLREAYGPDFAPEDLPVLEPRAVTVDHCVPVDYYIPGCPPPHAIVKDAIAKMLAGQAPSRVDLPVCAECGRIATRHTQSEIRRLADQAPEPKECLLSQGFICLGSVSRSGCGAVCTETGSPCWGCRGPIDRVLVEPTHGILFDLTRRISHFTGKSREQVQQQLPDMLHALYSFTLSTAEMRRKGAEAIHDHIQRIRV